MAADYTRLRTSPPSPASPVAADGLEPEFAVEEAGGVEAVVCVEVEAEVEWSGRFAGGEGEVACCL